MGEGMLDSTILSDEKFDGKSPPIAQRQAAHDVI